MKNVTWSSRFTKQIDLEVLDFSQSLSIDIVLYEVDIRVTIAHVQMLSVCGHIKTSEAKTIIKGLKSVKKLAESDKLPWSIEYEDVHMNIENALVALIGDLGKKIHLGRSRNDLVTTDLRLYLRDFIDLYVDKIRETQNVLAIMAKKYASDLFPGFTHMQVAQPVTFGHHLLAWNEMLFRDEKRLLNTRNILNEMPLGSAALSGTSLKIDRKMVAKELGFKGITTNSMDAVSDRDYVCDFAYTNSMIMMHLSRISEELVLWMNPQFGLVELDESFCTGSSIMPQKKNPDVPELIRGKAGSVYGSLIGLLTLMKGLPLTYNRDMQEDKTLILESIDITMSCLSLLPRLISTMKLNKAKGKEVAASFFSTATDLAEYLSKKGMPFRLSHHVVGDIVKYCEKNNLELTDLSIDQLKNFSPLISKDIYKALDPMICIKSRTGIGETSPSSVTKQANAILARLKKHESVK
ncbi:MAG: argininosuccinate lyase [Gammaproteobacteria bacterium]|mgnify:FL=1|jgi:argininosuccinate lyase|nr:argininosuccinate lyase [Gammaproteobacteria bacterium]MBT6733726.1 argininosuccinate lyase [Gammaproteobacteria bacterium]